MARVIYAAHSVSFACLKPEPAHPGGGGDHAALPRGALHSPMSAPRPVPLHPRAPTPRARCTQEGTGPSRQRERTTACRYRMRDHHRVQGSTPPLGHEIQIEFRFASGACRYAHGDPAVRAIQELSDRRGDGSNRVVDDHPGVAVGEHRCCAGHWRRHGRKAAQSRLYQHAWHTLTGGQTGEDEHV